MKRIQSILMTVCLFGGCAIATAQVEQNEKLDMDVVVEGIRENVIRDAGKISSNPKIKENVVELPTIKYSLIPNKINVPVEPKSIRPAKVNVEESLQKLYRGYARAGFGIYTMPLLDLYYMDGRSRNGSFSIHARHLSSSGGVVTDKDIRDSFSDNELHLWGKRFLGKHALEGGFDWERNVMNYYGLDRAFFPEAPIGGDSLEQQFNNVDGYLKLTSYFRDSTKVNYTGDVKFYNYSDAFDANENNVDFNAHAHKMDGNIRFSGDFNLNYNQVKYFDPLDSTSTQLEQDNLILGITPQASTIHDKWRVNVGMGIYVDARGEQSFHFYPHAEAKYNLVSNLFVPYVGVTGRLERMTYKRLTQINPWVLTNPFPEAQFPEDVNTGLRSTNHKLTLYGGIRGTISSNTSFNARISRESKANFAYFANDTVYSSGNQFVAFYDNLNFLRMMGEVAINTRKAFNMTLRGDFFIYGDIGEQLHAWDQPTLRLTTLASYNLGDKFLVTAELYHTGERKALSFAEVEGAKLEDDGSYTVDLDGFTDFNLEVEYRYTKRLSVWGRINNVFAGRYARWNQYNVQRFGAMMGASYSF